MAEEIKQQRVEYLEDLKSWFELYTSNWTIEKESTMKVRTYFVNSKFYKPEYSKFCTLNNFKNDMVKLGCEWKDCHCGTLGKLTYNKD